MDSPVPLMRHDPDRSWIPDPDPDHLKEHSLNLIVLTNFISTVIGPHLTSCHVKLSGSLSKSGPLHFGSENSFPSNFSQ